MFFPVVLLDGVDFAFSECFLFCFLFALIFMYFVSFLSFFFSLIYSLRNIHISFLCSHIAQLVEAGRGHLNIK